MPITYTTMLISTLAISGVPFFSGFLSKDAILAGTLSYYHAHHGWTIFLPIAGFGAAMVTAFYMFRLIFKTFHGEPRKGDIYDHIHESPLAMSVPLIILSVLSLAVVFTLPYVNPLDGHGWFTHARLMRSVWDFPLRWRAHYRMAVLGPTHNCSSSSATH